MASFNKQIKLSKTMKKRTTVFPENVNPTTFKSYTEGTADRGLAKMKVVGYQLVGDNTTTQKNYALYLNSITDPLGSLGGANHPSGYAAYILLYNNYRVLKTSVTIMVIQTAASTVPIVVCFCPRTASVADTDFEKLGVEPYAQTRLLATGTSAPPTVFQSSMVPQKLFGVTNEQYGSSSYVAAFGAHPTYIAYGELLISSADKTTNIPTGLISVFVEMKMQVEFSDRVQLDPTLSNQLVEFEQKLVKQFREKQGQAKALPEPNNEFSMENFVMVPRSSLGGFLTH